MKVITGTIVENKDGPAQGVLRQMRNGIGKSSIEILSEKGASAIDNDRNGEHGPAQACVEA